MVTPRLLPLSTRRLNGQMPKLYLLPWRMWWLRQNPSMVWWCGRVYRFALQPSPLTPYPLQLIVLPGEEIQRQLPETLHVEATGLGGRDLSYPIPWDISIRSDKEGQSVYGPSLAPMEETVSIPGPFGGSQTLQVTALGRSKAAHEFLVLHYFGVDSAMHWDVLTSEVLPAVQLPPQPAGPLHWKCLVPRTSHRPTAGCLTCCRPTQ